MIFNTGGYANQVTKSPTIKTNEGQADKGVRIKAYVVSKSDSTFPVVLKPFKFVLHGSSDTTPVQLQFTIKNVSRQTLTPRLVSSPKSLLSVSLPELIPPGGSGQATVKIKGAGLNETFEKSITLEFDDPAKSRFTVPIAYRLSVMMVPAGIKP
ncbi:MAG: DUF1573 domain-containing protein [Candidatus Zixiibacteriota bacterium]|nr:MAG: DUF1573 domain-containing protein [candidate division Zixibacteria bacterium]